MKKIYKILLILGVLVSSVFIGGGISTAGGMDGITHFGDEVHGYRTNNSKAFEIKDLFYDKGAYGQGYKVTNTSGKDYFIPTKTKAEGDAFKAHKPSGVSIESINSSCLWGGETFSDGEIFRVGKKGSERLVDAFPCDSYLKSNFAKCSNGTVEKIYLNDGNPDHLVLGWGDISDYPYTQCVIVPVHGTNKLKAGGNNFMVLPTGQSVITYDSNLGGYSMNQYTLEIHRSGITASCSTPGAKIKRLRAKCYLQTSGALESNYIFGNGGTMNRFSEQGSSQENERCYINGTDVSNGIIPPSLYLDKTAVDIRCRTGWSKLDVFSGACKIDIEAECEF